MNRHRSALGAIVFASLAAGNAEAALIGVTQRFPDITLTASPYLISGTVVQRFGLAGGAARCDAK